MRYTLGMGKYFGIPVRIHFTFPLILLFFGLEAGLSESWRHGLWAVLLVLCVFVCVLLHEFGHCFQVRRYGIEVRDIVLLPVGGMARAERIPESPREEIIVAVSGPLVNFALAGILFAIVWVRRLPLDFNRDFLLNLLAINLLLGFFNLIPAFPMDGGRILRGILAFRLPYLDATRYAKNVGQLIAIIFAVIGFLNPSLIMLAVIAVFIYFGAISEERIARVRFALDTKLARDFLDRRVSELSVEDSVRDAAFRLAGGNGSAYPVKDRRGVLTGAVKAEVLQEAMESGRANENLRPFVDTGFPLIDWDTPAVNAYYLLKSEKSRMAGLMRDGDFEGFLYYDDLAKAIP